MVNFRLVWVRSLNWINGNFPVLLEEINERRLELLDGGLVEIEVFFHLDQPALVDQDLEELFDFIRRRSWTPRWPP